MNNKPIKGKVTLYDIYVYAMLAFCAILVVAMIVSAVRNPRPVSENVPVHQDNSSDYQPTFRFGLGSDGATPFF